MNLDAFIARRDEAWRRLGTIVDQLTRTSPKRVSADQIRDMIKLYQQVSADLALLRTAGADPALVRRVNRLIIRTHDQLYRGSTRRASSLLWYFIAQYPRLFRQCRWYVIASLALCVSIYAMAYQTVQTDPTVVADILGGGGFDQEISGDKLPEDITERFRDAQKSLTGQGMSGVITVNNIRVALTAFAM